MTTERIAELEAALARIEHLEALSIVQENMPVPALQRRIAELEAQQKRTDEMLYDALETVDLRNAQLATVTTERDRYRKALEKIGHQAEKCRMWNGLMWIYHPPAVASIRKIAREAREGKG